MYEVTPIDRHFADFVCREAGDHPPVLRLVASLASAAVGEGNICLELAAVAGSEFHADGGSLVVPPLEELRACLGTVPVIGRPGQFRPLILDDGDRLYLYRYWRCQRDLTEFILQKTAEGGGPFDRTLLADGLARLFPSGGAGTDWQKVAALSAMWRRFAVISGGPGTGKTSTVVKILTLLLEQAAGRPLRIALAAPTGKAAARLRESIRLMKDGLCCADGVKARIPDEATTIHRLLGAVGDSTRFRFSRENPLPHDAVIVDEASMVSLTLMARLVTALKRGARFILLGDRDQLSSVEAGAVLGDLCGGGREELFSSEFAAFAGEVAGETIPVHGGTEKLPPLADSLVILKKNYRFGDTGGIGALSRAVNAGDGDRVLALLKDGSSLGVSWRPLPGSGDLKRSLAPAALSGYERYLAARTPDESLAAFDTFRILCAVRQGGHGVAGINRLVEDILEDQGLIEPRQRWYPGRPVMVTANDYGLKLFNGDVGLVLPDPGREGELRVFFPAPDGGVRSISPFRLPEHETVYAMTVHKTQGSEFEEVLLLLPEKDSPLLTRELIYTGITRARAQVEIWGREDVLRAAVTRRIERSSGLREALWPG